MFSHFTVYCDILTCESNGALWMFYFLWQNYLLIPGLYISFLSFSQVQFLPSFFEFHSSKYSACFLFSARRMQLVVIFPLPFFVHFQYYFSCLTTTIIVRSQVNSIFCVIKVFMMSLRDILAKPSNSISVEFIFCIFFLFCIKFIVSVTYMYNYRSYAILLIVLLLLLLLIL